MTELMVKPRMGLVWKAIWLSLGLGLMAAMASAADPLPVNKANYKQALHFNTNFLKQFTYDTAVNPNWIGKGDSFWYAFKTSKGTQYWRVEPKKAEKKVLFNHGKLAMLLSEQLQKPMDAALLPLSRQSMNDEGSKFKFIAEELEFEYDLAGEKLAKLGKPSARPFGPPGAPGSRKQFQGKQKTGEQKTGNFIPQRPTGRAQDYRVFSPDKKAYVFARNHNLFLSEEKGQGLQVLPFPAWAADFAINLTQAGWLALGQSALREAKAAQLTSDGAADFSFFRMATFGDGMDDEIGPPSVQWSSDSKAFYATRVDGRGVQELFLVNSLSMPRPTLEKYKYPMPGEEASRKMELFVCDRASQKLVKVQPKWKGEVYSNLHWGKTPAEFRFVRRDRLWRHAELCSMDVRTGETKCLIPEGFENASINLMPVQYLEETDEMLWWSERSGWGHFYLYDRQGKLKNAVTSGLFRASKVVAVDAKKRLMYFQGNGREANESVYNQHLYRVNLDGSGLALLDPGDAFHQSRLSQTKEFVVDNYSRTDLAPAAVLRDQNGKEILKLEEGDLGRLKDAGWKLPERFSVKAADGVTDLYGNMWKPFDFDPGKKYPVITNVYPGPQMEGVTHTFSAFSSNQQLAQLGFIVLQVGHRGGEPSRSKAYANFGYYNLRDYGLADKKAAIEQLAARFPFIDIERVGIYGHSGGGFMSAAAVLQKPYNEFFKAAVASAGNHDNNIYNNGWAERYHGMKEVPLAGASPAQENSKELPKTKFEIQVPTNAELAANLKGALLLVHGEIDNNVHPAGTLRLADALIKANKRFDMLILPGKRHGYGDYMPYFQQRMWDFFSDHLLGDRQKGADISTKGNPGN